MLVICKECLSMFETDSDDIIICSDCTDEHMISPEPCESEFDISSPLHNWDVINPVM